MIQNKQIGDIVKVMLAVPNTALTAGGSGDDTEVTGAVVDRAAIGMPQSAVLAIPFTAALADGGTLSVAYTVQEGDAANLSDAATLANGTLTAATGASGGSTETGCLEIDLKPAAGGRYMRVAVTPALRTSPARPPGFPMRRPGS